MRTAVLLLCLVLDGAGPRLQGAETDDSAAPLLRADLVIVGTGISGLAAALDAGRAGANVTVIDMWSVFGGHAVMSSGPVCLVDTSFQQVHNIADSPDLAIRDFLRHGEDANPDWVRLYARDSNREVYDWLDALGVGWSGLFPLLPGNSVQRQHSLKATEHRISCTKSTASRGPLRPPQTGSPEAHADLGIPASHPLARGASDRPHDRVKQASACLIPCASLRESLNREKPNPKFDLSEMGLVIQGI